MTGANAKIKRIMIGDKQVRPVWKPNANTLFYFPLESNAIDTVNSISLSSNGTTNYTTVGGVKSAEFTKSNWLYNNSVSVIPQGDVEKTFSVWAYIKGGNSNWQGFVQCGSGGTGSIFGLGLYTGKYTVVMTRYGSTSNEYTPTLNRWTNFIATYKNSVWKLYVDGVLKVTWNVSAPTSGNSLFIGQNIGETKTACTFYGNISNVILENKEWAADGINLYYRATKSNYGL